MMANSALIPNSALNPSSALISSMDSLPIEIWSMIGLHLKQRHLLKLMMTCKSMKLVVDNEAYWTRVAAHLVWRDCEAMEVCTWIKRQPWDILPPLQCNLYGMIGLDFGYYQGMNSFLQRINEMITKSAEEGEDWLEYQVADLKTKTVMLFKKEHIFSQCASVSVRVKLVGDEDQITMKEFTRRIVVQCQSSISTAARKMRGFVNDLDDSTIPTKNKREIMTKLSDLLWSLDHPSEESSPSPFDIACEICKF